MEDSLLSIRQVTITFGGLHAVEDLSFEVCAGQIVSLIGPNGAGKTTLLNSVSGFVPARGSIRHKGVELLGQPAYRRAGLGIGRTFQNLQLFGSMTLLDNVLVGQHAVLRGSLALDLLRLPVLERERQGRERAMHILEQLGLERYAGRRVDQLAFGLQKLAGVARALASRPDLLLLDEPAAGLNQHESGELGDLLLKLRDEMSVTILLVEHNMKLVMGISDRVVVLDQGQKLAEGLPSEVRTDRSVIEAYLGSVHDTRVVAEVQRELS